MTINANVGTQASSPSAPVPIVGIDEIHALLVKVSKQLVLELTFRSDFPEPAAELAQGDVWLLEDVDAWINEHGNAVAEMLNQAR